MKLKHYLIETTVDSSDWADCTDNFPPSTTIFGEKMSPKEMDSVNGKLVRFVSGYPNFNYDEWKNSDGMEDPIHFHRSILGLRSIIKREDFHPKKNMHPKPSDDKHGSDVHPEEPDGPATTINPQQKDDPQFAVNRREFKEFAKVQRTLPVVKLGTDGHDFYKLDIDKVVGRRLAESMNVRKYKDAAGPKNLYTWKGKPFWSGAFDPIDGNIEEVHTFEEAEEADFHHSFYFDGRTLRKMDQDKLAFFWLDDHGLNTQWRNDEAPPKIKKAIMDQIKKR